MATENTNTRSENVEFLTIAEFKAHFGLQSEKAQVIQNPKTSKLFLSIGSKNFKCQADIDGSREMRILVDNKDYENACLVNVTATENNVMFTL